jgi:hypothetical protein
MAKYVVTLPDGRKFQITAPDGASQSDVMAYAQKQFAAAQAPAQDTQAPQATTRAQPTPRPFFEAPKSVADVLGPLEAAAHIASGIGGQVAGGLAGLASIPANLLRGQSLQNAVANSGNTVSSVENALTYEPRTAVGHDIANVVQYPFQKLGEAADYAGGKVTDLTGSPLAGTAVNTAINSIPMLLGAKGDFKAPAASDFASRVPEAVANARQAGFKLTPTQAQVPHALAGRIAESLSSHAKLERDISRKNAQAVDAAAGREIGINGPVTAESLNAAKAPHNAVYDEVSSLGTIPTDAAYRQALGTVRAPGAASFPGAAPTTIDSLRAAFDVPSFNAADAVAMTRQLRADASKNIKAPFDPERNALGFAQRSISDALESQIERHLQNAAEPATNGAVATNKNVAGNEVPRAAGGESRHGVDEATGLPLNDDGTVTVYHHTTPEAAAEIRKTGSLHAEAEPDVYVTTRQQTDTGYGDTAVPIRVDPSRLVLDDEFPGGRRDFRMNVGRPGGSIKVKVPNDSTAPVGSGAPVDPTLVARFQAARQSLAKIHSVEDALKAGKGQAVSAANLGKQLRKGAPLSGNLRTIAESAENFPRAFQDLDKIRNSGPLSMLPTYGGGLLTAAHPAAWPALAGAVLGPPTLRAILGSELYQRAAFDPRVPQTYARPGLLGLGGTAALSGQGSQATIPMLLLRSPQMAAGQ